MMFSRFFHSNIRLFDYSIISPRRGSALLIVLGMLSFMVISAVSFAMFMRQSRLPSSYLRRTASSRYLLKAALANAISRLDGCYTTANQIAGHDVCGGNENGFCEGIYDDPYPGVGERTILGVGGGGMFQDGGFFDHRVFCPFGRLGVTEDGNQVPHYETVSTLTLEGLAYLPPAIINEVRVYSRLTRTAKWRNLAFDAGRYAFCAVDVSDCFDINRLCAEERRLAEAGERINLGSLFSENGGQLENILKQCSNHCSEEGGGSGKGGSNIPFVSLADFNLVAGKVAFSPFCQCIDTANGINPYIDQNEAAVKNALFITDTWFPPTNTTTAAANRIDLSKDDSDNQPFPDYTTKNLMDIDHRGKLYQLLMHNIGGCGLTCLYDYLDEDRIPLSLALPTVETVPMVCGLGMAFDDAGGAAFALKVEAKPLTTTPISYVPDTTNPNVTRERTITSYNLTVPSCQISQSGVAVFPFKHISGNRKGSFKVETLSAVFFAADNLKSRVAGTALRPTAADWTASQHVRDGVIWCKGEVRQQPSFQDNLTRMSDAAQQFVVEVNVSKTDFALFHHVTETETEKDNEGNVIRGPVAVLDKITTDATKNGVTPLTVYDAEGSVPQEWTDAYNPSGYKADLYKTAADLQAGNEQNWVTFADSKTYRLYVATWVRIVDSKQTGKSGGAVVDLVPATCDDDETYLAGCTYEDKTEVYKMTGSGTPLLDFPSDRKFTFSNTPSDWETALNGTAAAFDWDTLYAHDPRYNFAPEDWFASANKGGDAKPADWLTHVTTLLGTNGRDPDIFLFTSDQEFLQSIGELAFLPRVQQMTGNASFFEGDFMGVSYAGSNNFQERQDTRFCAHNNFMWRTYSPVAHNGGTTTDPIYSMTKGGVRYEVVSGTGDFRVNPFSPDERVLMAALKDTPADYYFASADETLNPTATKEARERASFAFCENSTIGAKLADDELEDIADAFRRQFANWAENTKGRNAALWELAYDDMDWYDDNSKKGDAQTALFDIEEEFDNPFHAVDRKYLYSFWRECFQNRQQLFLIFLRAEPLTVGGMGEGSLASAQLGARGVALVWRDPLPPTRGGNQRPLRHALTGPEAFKNFYDNFGPHRTRVLFYHQFD